MPSANIAVSDLLLQATARLTEAGIDRPAAEARRLVAHACGIDRESLIRDPAHLVHPKPAWRLVERRAGREPLAFILGTAAFWTLTLEVGPATLIPRPDSETLIEAARAALPNRHDVHSVLDLGTGTGCLLLAGLTEFPAAHGIGVDRAPSACALAARNAAANGLAARTGFVCADWAAPLAVRFDLILCNPPYIPTADIAGLMPEVARFEPTSALDGGADGLASIRALLPLLPGLLTPGGVAILELGAGQADTVLPMAAEAGLHGTTRPDLGGHQRALVLRCPPG